MENILKIVNKLQKAGLIKNYAIGNDIAAIYYTEPFYAKEMDVFFTQQENINTKKASSMICAWLKSKGYKRTKDMPLHLISATDELTREAIEKSVRIKYRSSVTRIFRPEYIIAVMMMTHTIKDKEIIQKLLRQTKVNKRRLNVILNRFGLMDKFSRYQEWLNRVCSKETPLPSDVSPVFKSMGRNIPTCGQIYNFPSSLKSIRRRIFKAKEQWRQEMAKKPFPAKINDLRTIREMVSESPYFRRGDTIVTIGVS
jgi:hypothetical protein